jgi:MFS family permease
LRDVAPPDPTTLEGEHPLKDIILRPAYLVAVLSGAVAYGVMSFTMTATPVYLNRMHGYSIAQTAWIIQSHVIAMYVPSLFTGFIVERLGVLRVMGLGVLGLLASAALGVASRELIHFWGTLVLLGVGWNFLFVGATVLLTRSYTPAERFKAQATNDFIIFGIQAFTSLSAGTVLFRANWDVLNLLNLPFLVLVLATLLLLNRQGALRPSEA